jgi:carbon monoxide dehydrogenase subunit G
MAYPLEPIDDRFFDEAPVVVRSTVDLDATPEEVWEALASDRMWSWFGGVDRLQWRSPRPLVQGCVRRLRLARLTTIDEEFYRWEPPRRATFRVTQATRPVLRGLAEDFILEPLPGGRTRLTWVMAIDAKLPGAKVFGPLMKPANQRAIAGIASILPPR